MKYTLQGATAILYLVLNLHVALAGPREQSPLHSHNTKDTKVIDADFSSFVEDDILKKRGIKGLALTIVKPNDVVEFGTWGISNENEDSVTPDTLFCIASCSKAFLASSIGILIDDYANGKNSTPLPPGLAYFDWDTKMKDLLPNDWKLQDEWASRYASLRDVLSHVSGLPSHDLSYGPNDKPIDVIRRMRFLQTTFELREKWSYNNQMYMTVAHLVSTLTGTPYPNFVRNRIFDPLGIPSSNAMFSPSDAEETGNLTQTWFAQDNTTILRIPFWFNENAAKLSEGAGGVITSVRQLSKWLKLLINSGVLPGTNTTIIPRSAYEAMTSSTAIVRGIGSTISKDGTRLSVIGYGMGWIRYSIDGHDLISHTGSIPGYKTFVGFLPHEKLGVAVTFNTELGPGNGDPNMDVVIRVLNNVLGIRETTSRSPEGKDGKEDELRVSTEPPAALSSLAGSYSNNGYGTFTLCAQDTKSDYCNGVRADFGKIDSIMAPKRILRGNKDWIYQWERAAFGTVANSSTSDDSVPGGNVGQRFNTWGSSLSNTTLGPHLDETDMPPAIDVPRPAQLLARWPRIWSTHLRLIYISSTSQSGSNATTNAQTVHKFAIRPSALFPEGYGDGSRPREPFELPMFENEGFATWATVEFVVEDGKVTGAGASGNGLVPGDATRWMKEGQTGDVKEDSLVWFERV